MPTDLTSTVRAVLSIAGAASEADGIGPLDEATVLAVTNRPESLTIELRDHGFALLNGTEVSVVVAPSERGTGLGTELTSSIVRSYDDASTTPLTAWMHGESAAARALAARAGFTPVRELWVMRRYAATAPSVTGMAAPEGVVLRHFLPGDEAEVLRVNAAAFAWHPEQGAMDLANLRERMAQPWFRPEDLIEVWEDTRLLGFHWTKRHSAELGEIYVVGVDPSAQGRKLGRLLTLAGLDHLAGLPEIHLYVESDNIPAVRLYESLGFTHAAVDTHVQFSRPVEPNGSPSSSVSASA